MHLHLNKFHYQVLYVLLTHHSFIYVLSYNAAKWTNRGIKLLIVLVKSARVEFRSNLICDMLMDICYKVVTFVHKEALMGLLSKARKDLLFVDLLLFI